MELSERLEAMIDRWCEEPVAGGHPADHIAMELSLTNEEATHLIQASGQGVLNALTRGQSVYQGAAMALMMGLAMARYMQEERDAAEPSA